MGFVDATKTCLSKYATFSGRAVRSEYWWFFLFVVLASMVLAVVDMILFGTDPETGESPTILSGLFQIAMFLPLLAAGWRRLHDTGRPGWYLLLPMLVSIVFMISVFSGIMVFGLAETHMADPDMLRGPAAMLSGAGMLIFSIVQTALAILMIWWLTRPSDNGSNAYGPAVV